MADPIVTPEPAVEGSGEPAPKTAFWDLAPLGVYVQFDERLITPWERVKLAGVDLPGRCSVASPGRIRKVQTYSGPGDEGEQVIDTGAMAAEVAIVVQIWTPAHLARWEAFTEKVGELLADAREDLKKGQAEVPALDVVHPGLNLAGIRSIYVYQVGVLTPSSVSGVMEATILGSEYRRVKKAKSQAIGPVENSLDGLDRTPLATELEKGVAKKPIDTEAGP